MMNRRNKECRGTKHLLEHHTIAVKMIRAARAIFVDRDSQLIDLSVTLEDGTMVTLTLTPRIAADLIQQTTIAYEAINPPLRRGGGTNNMLI